MNVIGISSLIGAVLFVLAAMPAAARDAVCASDKVTLSADFPMARMSSCEVVSDHRFRITIAPEDEPPINHSPWYAFRVGPHEKSVRIEMRYTHHKHRYWPKISYDGRTWVALDTKHIEKKGKDKVQLMLPPSEKAVFVSAQEFLSNAAIESWLDQHARVPGVRKSLIGSSAQGRSIFKLETEAEAATVGTDMPVLMLVGRQHPPEVPGALASLTFANTILGDSDLARRFRRTFAVVIIPNLNPDGVDLGHWRHNTAGKDLNRDWGPFEHVETQVMLGELDRYSDAEADHGRSIWLFLDFHSTSRNVFYTQTDEAERFMPGFTQAWMDAAGPRIPDYEFDRSANHNIGRPTSKKYMFKRFGIPAMTYEVGDETNRTLVHQSAAVFAEEAMRLLLEWHAKNVRAPHDQ